MASLLASLDWIKTILIAIVLVGAYYFLVFNDGSTIVKNIETLKQQTSDLDIQFITKQKEYQKYEELNLTLNKQKEDFERLSKVMSSKESSADFFKLISREARSAGLELVGISESPSHGQFDSVSMEKEIFSRFEVQVQLKGTYSQFMGFLSYLTRINKVITVNALTLSQNQQTKDYVDPHSDKSISIQGSFISHILKTNIETLENEKHP